jgi:glycosyltransferase involved in cell wall biosynthesis
VRILAFNPFDGGSHRAVRESISRWSRHEWTWVTRPGRAWKWRMRLAALEMIEMARGAGALDLEWDALFVTSMLSAADLVAALPLPLRATPVILYMHENQAAYPAGHATPSSAARDVHFALTNLTSMHAAQLVIWNSEWNRSSFAEGIGTILAHAPDLALAGGCAPCASAVAWPPVEAPPAGVAAADDRAITEPVRVAWPHRWEHDKDPDALLAIAEEISARIDVRWTILGRRFRDCPPALEAFARRFADRIDHFGYAEDRTDYWRRLARCDWVLSTARHEFFGIAVAEALLAGCLPWLPERLSYVEILPPAARGLSPLAPPEDESLPILRAAIRAHLAAATAPRAVARLDALAESVLPCGLLDCGRE